MKRLGLLFGIFVVISTLIGWVLLVGQNERSTQWPDQGTFDQHG